MIIRKIYIENFGHFHDFTLELAPGLNRLRHENEFGKSTLLEFVRRVLWGFPDGRKRQLNHYPARFNAGKYGGYLEVELADGSSAVLERYGVRGELVVRRPDGSTEPGEEFLRRLTPISGDCYREVYAITLDELAEFSNLDGEELRGRLYGGAITGGDVSLPDLGKFLDAKAKELYKQRGASKVAAARQEFRACCETRDRAVNDSFRRVELEKERIELDGETAKLRAEAETRAKAVAAAEVLLKAHPRYLELGTFDRELAARPPAPEVPASAAARAEELAKRLEDMKRGLPPAPDETRIPVLAAEAALLDRELAGSGGETLPEENDLHIAELLEKQSAALAEPVTLPPWIWIAALLAAVCAVAAAVPALRIPALALAVMAAAGAFWGGLSHRRRRKLQLRLAAETEQAAAEFRGRLKLDCPPEKFVAVLKARLRRRELADELAKLQTARRAHDEAAAAKRELDELCRRFNCADPAQMRECAQRFSELAALRRRRAEAAAALDALLPRERQIELAKLDPESARRECADAARAKAEADRELFLLHQKAGALANELKHLPQGGEVELLESEVERARGELRRLVREYLVLRAARGLLDAAVARYERESQPEVLKRAEALFGDFTGARYTHLYKSVATGELTVSDGQTGLEKTFDALSRGTREELMLAMLLALVECTERDAEPLPVCFDDVGVNFDAARLKRVEGAVEKFSEGRQVIWFSHS